MDILWFTMSQSDIIFSYLIGLAVFLIVWFINILDETPVYLWKSWKVAERKRETARDENDKSGYKRYCSSAQDYAQKFIKSMVGLVAAFLWPVAVVLWVLWVVLFGIRAIVTVVKGSGGLVAAATGKFED